MTTRRDYQRAYYLAHREELLAKNAARWQKHKARYSEAQRRWNEGHREEIAARQRASYLRRRTAKIGAAARPMPQGCELCGRMGSRGLHFDHDHATGAFRGWLCQNCNRALGYVHDSVELLSKMIEYLKASRGPRLVQRGVEP